MVPSCESNMRTTRRSDILRAESNKTTRADHHRQDHQQPSQQNKTQPRPQPGNLQLSGVSTNNQLENICVQQTTEPTFREKRKMPGHRAKPPPLRVVPSNSCRGCKRFPTQMPDGTRCIFSIQPLDKMQLWKSWVWNPNVFFLKLYKLGTLSDPRTGGSTTKIMGGTHTVHVIVISKYSLSNTSSCPRGQAAFSPLRKGFWQPSIEGLP